jgi:hypothetical protein
MRARFILAAAMMVALVAPARMAGPASYGTGVSVPDTTPLTRVLERPADFAGKTVKVEGVVTAVCSEMGCWMALAPEGAPNATADAKAKTLLIKVEEGVVVLPVSAKGHRAAAQGVMQRVGGSDAHDHEAAAEHAKTEGRAAESAEAWQLKATGALVY